MNELDSIQSFLQRKAGRRDQIKSELESASNRLETLTQEQEDISRSLEIIQQVAKLTQQQLEIHISELVSLALEAVFPNPYKMVLKFETRRNRSEADLLLQDADGNLLSPMDAVGGGVVDVAAFALRIALWSLKRPRPRAIMLMDEPFRFLSSDLQDRASQMLKEIGNKLKIQFLIITHEEQLLAAADRVFRVAVKNGSSKITSPVPPGLQSPPPIPPCANEQRSISRSPFLQSAERQRFVPTPTTTRSRSRKQCLPA